MPRINRILVIFEPIILLIANSVAPWALEKILIKSSGMEVPNATIVIPMTKDDMPYFLAIEDEPSTKRSAPLINITKPVINKKYVIIVQNIN